MPLVKVEIIKEKTPEYKKQLLDSIHAAMKEVFHISDRVRKNTLYELDKENFLISPPRTDKFTLIEITIFRGRKTETKKRLYSAINDKLAKSPGIDGEDIEIILYELPLENCAPKKGIPATELKFDFKIKL